MRILISFPLMDLERFFLLINTIPKIWGKRTLNVKGFLNISRETEIHGIPIAWDKGTPIVLTSMGKFSNHGMNEFSY